MGVFFRDPPIATWAAQQRRPFTTQLDIIDTYLVLDRVQH